MLLAVNLENHGAIRRPMRQGIQKSFDILRLPLHINLHIGALVADTAAQMMCISNPADKGAEAYSLHDAIDTDDPSLFHDGSPSPQTSFR